MSDLKVRKLNSLSDLKSIDLGSFGVLGDIELTDKVIEEEPVVVNEVVVENEAVIKDVMPSNLFRVELHNGCKSCNEKDLKFSNRLENVRTTASLNSKIIEILKMDGQDIDSNDIKLTYEEKLNLYHPRTGRRARKILMRNGIMETDIDKSRYKDSAKAMYGSEAGDVLRIYSSKNTRERLLKILIFDPYHLLATSETSNYKDVSKFSGCIGELNTAYKKSQI